MRRYKVKWFPIGIYIEIDDDDLLHCAGVEFNAMNGAMISESLYFELERDGILGRDTVPNSWAALGARTKIEALKTDKGVKIEYHNQRNNE